MRPVLLATRDNGDGTSMVTLGTAAYGQASVTVRNDQLDTPEVWDLYEHVANLDQTAYTAVRRSRRDEKRQGG